jgi:hypothetical protein
MGGHVKEGGFWWRMTWVVEVLLCAVLVPLMFSISALFNIVPWFEQDWMMGVATTAMALCMGAIPFSLGFLPWGWWTPAIALGVFLCFMLWQGAAEQISMTRDKVSSGAVGKINESDAYKASIELYIANLKWRVGSQEKVDSAKEAFKAAAARSDTVCKAAPFGDTCATTKFNAAQGALNEANDVWEWTKKKSALDIEIPRLEREQSDLHAPTEDPQARSAARTANYLNKFGFKFTPEEVNDERQ